MELKSTIKKALGFGVEEKSLSLNDPETFSLFGVTPTSSGISISPNSAMRVPAFACGVAHISEAVGSLPAKLYDRSSKATLDGHPAYRLIHDQANEWTGATQFRRDLTLDAHLHGAGHGLVIRSQDGTPLELQRLDPSKVQQLRAPDGEPYYIISTDSGQVHKTYRDVLRIEALGGVSPITLGREAIALALSFERHIGNVVKNGGRPSGVLKSPKKMGAEDKKNLIASWFNTHGGNKGDTALLEEGMDYLPISMTLVDAQFQEGRVEQIREIGRVLRIPPTMLYELTRGTWSNTEEMSRQFHMFTLKPWLTDWAWAYACVLLTPEERADLYIEFVTDDFLATDTAARANALGQYRSMGVMTANEVRRKSNLPPLEGGDTLENPYTTSNKDKAA